MTVSTWAELGWPFMALLVILAVIALVCFIERFLFLHRGQIRPIEFLQGIENLLRSGRLVEAVTACEDAQAPVARVVKVALVNHNQDIQHLRETLIAHTLLEMPLLERRVAALLTIAKTAPLIGFIGTLAAVFKGMVQLNHIGPYAEIAQMAAYLAAAIYVSAFGMGIAVLCQLGYHLLYGRVKALVNDMEWASHEILRLHDTFKNSTTQT